jgi:phospholipid-binding lipoprotein MlaA
MSVPRPALPVYILLIALAGLVTSACTTLGTAPESEATQDDETWDPFEPFNRAMFSFNETFDQWLLKPVARSYDWVMPDVAKQGVGNFFSNLVQPRVAVNDLLQGKFSQSGRDAGRFLVNSTVGILGLVDVAKYVGLEPKEEDWGQTFAVWGMRDGPYFVWPIIGPRYARDTLGFGFDWLSNPVTYVEPPAASWGLWGLDIVDTRARFLPAEKVLNQAMGDDKYIFIREAYRQRRRNLIYDGNPPKPSFFEDDTESSPPKPAPASDASESPIRSSP